MPTSYTQPVQDGQITTLAQYAMLCARAFGATITMRDLPLDAPIPDKFEAMTYHQVWAQTARDRLARLARMSPCEAQAECQADNASAVRRWKKDCDSRAIHRARYQAMLNQALAWTPPTRDHDRFHVFMIEQLEQSLNFDCHPTWPEKFPSPERWPEWLARQREQAEADIEYHTQNQAADDERNGERMAWVRTLRGSLQ